MNWIEPAPGDDTGCQADYYYLSDARFRRMAGEYGLRAIYRDRAAHAALAEPGAEARRRLGVVRSLGFSAPCNAGVLVKDAWVDAGRLGAARSLPCTISSRERNRIAGVGPTRNPRSSSTLRRARASDSKWTL